MLDEVGLPYRVIAYDLFGGEYLTPAYRRINPNNKFPAIVDHAPADEGEPVAVFESGAILIYLAEKTGQLSPSDWRRRLLAQQWTFWQVAGLGPMHGKAHHFVRYAPEGQDYAIARYTNEARRLLDVLEYRLEEAENLAEEYSIADIACWPWTRGTSLLGIDLADFPAISRWYAAIASRPAVIAATTGFGLISPDAYRKERAALTPEQWSNFFGERLFSAARTRVRS